MKFRHVALLAAIFLLSMGLTGLALANHIGVGLVTIPALIVNNRGANVLDIQLPFNLSSQTLIDGLYIESDAFDSDVQEGDTHIPFMPGTGQVQMLACFNNASVNETAACNNSSINDITLPITGAEVYEFAFDNQARHLWLDISTGAIATWTVEWQYWNGSSYVALSGITDKTNGFAQIESNNVTWDFPIEDAWPQSILHSIEGYWIRAEITSFTSITTSPVGRQAWYETGRWWILEDAIEDNEQKRYDVRLSTAAVTGSATFIVISGSDDAQAGGSGAVFPPPFTGIGETFIAQNAINSFSGGIYTYANFLVRFDTSVIPDSASVTSAILSCTLASSSDDDDRNLIFEYYPWETAAVNHYETTSQANAHSGTDITVIPSLSPHPYVLSNIVNISKSGFTGLRGFIDGGVPLGNNLVALATIEHPSESACTLDVIWNNQGQFHFYIPHKDGYTIADNAAMELGSVYSVGIAGYFQGLATASVTGSTISKPGAFELERGPFFGGHRLTINGSSIGLLVLNDYQTINVTQGVTGDAVVSIDGSEFATFPRQTIIDNANDWVFFQHTRTPDISAPAKGILALDYVQIEVDQSTELLHQIRDLPDFQLEDHTGNGHDVIIRYPDTISGFTSSLQSAQGSAAGGDITEEPGPEVIGDFDVVDDYSETNTVPGSGFILFDVLNTFTGEAASAGAFVIPFQAISMIMSVALVLFGMVLSARVGINHALIFAFIMLALLTILWRMGGVPGWFAILMGGSPILFFLMWKRFTP